MVNEARVHLYTLGTARKNSSLRHAARFAIFLLLVTAARLAAGALAPLTEDEAYYRLWSLRPAFGYFDHPPMIAWWIWLGRRIAGEGAIGVRLLPILGCALTSIVTVDLARLAGAGERTAYRSGLWLNATLLIGLGGLLAVPDAPNTLFWVVTVWCAFRARSGRPTWWLACGAAAGLACLSKYSALFLGPGLLLWLAMSAEGRRQLRTPWPWLAAGVAATIFLPNVLWNATHHWPTFAKQFGRVRGAGFAPQHLPELLVDQFLLLNPSIAVFAGIALARRPMPPLIAIAAPFALYLLVHSLHDQVQGQWPAPLYPLLVICAAQAAETAGGGGWLGRIQRFATPFGLTASALALAFICAPLGARLPFRDPSAPLRGWPGFFATVERTRRQVGASWVGTASYGLAAQLAAQPRADAPVSEIRERQRYTFEVAAGRADFRRPGLVIDQPGRLSAVALRRCFNSVAPVPALDRGDGAAATSYVAFRVSGPRRDVNLLGC